MKDLHTELEKSIAKAIDKHGLDAVVSYLESNDFQQLTLYVKRKQATRDFAKIKAEQKAQFDREQAEAKKRRDAEWARMQAEREAREKAKAAEILRLMQLAQDE